MTNGTTTYARRFEEAYIAITNSLYIQSVNKTQQDFINKMPYTLSINKKTCEAVRVFSELETMELNRFKRLISREIDYIKESYGINQLEQLQKSKIA